MKNFTSYLTLMGTVGDVTTDPPSFIVRCRSGDEFIAYVGNETPFAALRNLDELDRDRFPNPEGWPEDPGPGDKVAKYIRPGHLVVLQGIYHEFADQGPSFEARAVYLLQTPNGEYLFEAPHWWPTQIGRLADQWLDQLFQDRRTYMEDDFAELYRSNLNIGGLPTDDATQECATLSRLIYGLSSAYLLTGCDRYLMAARAGVAHQRHAFRNLSHGGYCFWAFGRRRGRYGSQTLVASENPDDAGSIPLYEQIYALAGLAQYYRITADWEVLEDIRLSVRAFNRYYRDSAEGGYFSHLDYVTMRADSDALGQNQARKNWNSVGDHLPAYLVNVILALEPLSQDDHDGLGEFLAECKEMLGHTSDLIVSKFPDPPNPYVNERFLADWTPDHHWGWQQNRAIVGHNLKIAWNLTRVANYYRWRAAQKDDDASEIDYKQKAEALTEVAAEIGLNMVEHGLDQIRSGVFDAVERDTRVGKGLNFPWANTKDFWQQEQGILAYLILHGATRDRRFLDLAREVAAFWNLFFLDHDYRGIFFRVTDNGDPVIRGDHGKKGGHAISGYHAFELNYLAHIYTRTYADGARGNFCLYFNPSKDSGVSSINVLPDFVPPGSLTVAAVTVNGRRRRDVDPDNFRIPLAESELGSELVVEFAPREVANGRP